MDKIWYANSGSGSELVTQIPVKVGSGEPYTRKVVYSIALPDLCVGDLLSARAHYEVSNPYTSRKDYNIMSARGMILADSPSAVSGVLLMEEAAENVPWATHHQCIASFGGMKITEDMTGKYINVIGFAGAGPAYYQAGDYLKVEPNYGRLEVFVYPACMVAD